MKEDLEIASQKSRRDFLVNSAKFAGLAFAGLPLAAKAATSFAGSIVTPAQTEGPFYPVQEQSDKDADMTRVQGRSIAALGQIVSVIGVVVDADTNEPVKGAMVEFWQACATGKYNHPEDPNTAELDPNFQYWSQVVTDNYGDFRIRTIKPGVYPATDTWIRPPHIHVKVHARGYPSLTTQLYFEGDALNQTDEILKRVPTSLRHLVVVKFNPQTNPQGEVSLAGMWTVRIAKKTPIHLNKDQSESSVTPTLD